MSEPVGIIYPSPELRGIVDSTAKYVAKNGGAFEERIKREHRDKPKFSFLFSGDPFNAYYQYKVKEIRNSLLGELDSKLSQEHSSQQQQQQQQQSTTGHHRDVDANNHQYDHSGSQTEQSAHQKDHNAPVASDSQDFTDRKCHDSNHQQEPSNYQEQQHFADGPDGSRGGEQGGRSSSQEETSEANPVADGAPRVRLKLNEYIQEMTMKLEEPPQLNYLATSAPSLTHMDCDITKLTAQFIAKHGRDFLLELVSREQNNSQFDFLKPQHGQFSYMTNLIMQYALIRNQPLDLPEQLGKDATSQKHVIDKIKMRAEWSRMLELEQKKREEAEEKKKILYSQIDWNDFVIVETIDYRPNERGEYPPTTADQVGTRLLMQQRYEERNVPEEMEIDMDVESDQESGDEELEEGQFAVPELLPPKPEKVFIRKDYDPKAANKVAANQPDNYFVSPITNERIPVDRIHDHVRYNLSDSKYLEKKDQMLQEKINEEAVFASGSQIQSSLKNLAERRTDIFGTNDRETAIGRRIGEEEQIQPKDDRLIWDGHKSSLKKKKIG